MSRLQNRNVIACRGRTSMRLEPELWDALREIAEREDLGIGNLVRAIEEAHQAQCKDGGRTSAVRVYVVNYFRNKANAPPAP